MQFFVPKKSEKEVISIRLPSEILEIVDRKSADADISRNEFINQCILFALANLKEPSSGADDASAHRGCDKCAE